MSYIIPKKREIINEMLDRPVVNSDVVSWLRSSLKPCPPYLREIEAYALENRVPIIPKETMAFLDFFLGIIKPKQILEIGTAIGYSALLMAQHLQDDGHLTTIDRFDVMIKNAKENFSKSPYDDKITLIESDAEEILPKLDEKFYDVVFMDSAKSKYHQFLPYCIRVLRKNGILIVDDIFQGGTVFADEDLIPRRVKKIHRELKKFLDVVLNHPNLKSTVLPLGDGLILIEKLEENIIFE